jgi:hypothetical protein
MEYFTLLWKCSGLLWDPPCFLLFKREREFVTQGKIGTGVKQFICLHLVSRIRMNGAKFILPIRLHSPHRNDFTFFMLTDFKNIGFSRRETGCAY